MELEPDQQHGGSLRQAMAPWFDNPASWLVLLCAGLAGLAPFLGSVALSFTAWPQAMALHIVVALSASVVIWRAGRLRELTADRRRAWRWLTFALVANLCAMLAVGAARAFDSATWRAGANLLQLAFLAFAAGATLAFLRSTRQTALGPQFPLDALIAGLCFGALLWLAVPIDIPLETNLSITSLVQPLFIAALDCVIFVLAAILLLRQSDWQGWTGLVAFALSMIARTGSRLLDAAAQSDGGLSSATGSMFALVCAGFAIAAHFDFVRTERKLAPANAAERGSPLAPFMPYSGPVLAVLALLALNIGNLAEPSGLLAWIVAVSVPLLLARQAFATSLIAAAQAQLARRAAEARLSALIKHSADVIAIVGADGTMSFLTASAERVFGQPAEALIGRPIADLAAVEDRPRLREFIARDLAKAGATAVIEARIPRGADKQRIVEIHGTNLDKEPTVGGRVLNLRDTTDRKGLEEQLRRLAFHDPLTLLANRALFRDRVEHALAVGKRSGRGVAVLFIDLDNFKKINDSLGHGQGDRVLRTSAQRLVKCTRNGDTVARLGGDEFAVLLENLVGREAVVEVAERIVEALQEPFAFLGSNLCVAASIGVAFATANDGVEELLRNADVAMYAAKSQGKGRYVIFESAMQHAAHQRLEVEAELSRALTENQFQIHYQPIVELRSGYLLGVEALVRWRHPKRGLVAPAEFIGVAEDSGQLVALGRWVLCQACKEVRAWQDKLPEGRQIRVAVNVSAGQLAKSDLIADVTWALQQSELDPGCLVIEMTESVLMQNTDDTLAKLTRIKKLGVRIAIDDFGTGYSSLSYLHRFPIDILKIDRSFIERLGALEDGAALARAIITLGDTLGLEVVAKGIELEHQKRELIELGCVAGQGYYYSKPALLHELEYSVHMQRRRTMADTLPQGTSFTATGRFLVGELRLPDPEPAATGTFGVRPDYKI